ncbi:MAG TPA: hypothetical protein DEF59_04070 [Candidatus Magasanikbacteria bacterium]|nr:hypothetical protein [Candidatus Magasanikbacteria bacterium]
MRLTTSPFSKGAFFFEKGKTVLLHGRGSYMKIRTMRPADEEIIRAMYRDAFAGAPWFEKVPEEEVLMRWESHRGKIGFSCLVAEEAGELMGATWWDTLTIDALSAERGETLAEFALREGTKAERIIWIRETVVFQRFQGRGIARMLKAASLEVISAEAKSLILTRMRDDNMGILHVAQRFGFKRTGIRMPSKSNPDVWHEYWYLTT